jgi:putative NIF3 family GTP cyclohydrolase 1 type 2
MKIVISIVALLIFVGITLFIPHSRTDAQTNTVSDIVARIAEKFNLKQEDVQKVFDEEKARHKAQWQKNLEAKLNDAVKNGDITDSQRQAILEKQKEIQSFRDSLKNLPDDQRKEKIRSFYDELQKWINKQGLTKKQLRKIGLFGIGHWHMHRFKAGF